MGDYRYYEQQTKALSHHRTGQAAHGTVAPSYIYVAYSLLATPYTTNSQFDVSEASESQYLNKSCKHTSNLYIVTTTYLTTATRKTQSQSLSKHILPITQTATPLHLFKLLYIDTCTYTNIVGINVLWANSRI